MISWRTALWHCQLFKIYSPGYSELIQINPLRSNYRGMQMTFKRSKILYTHEWRWIKQIYAHEKSPRIHLKSTDLICSIGSLKTVISLHRSVNHYVLSWCLLHGRYGVMIWLRKWVLDHFYQKIPPSRERLKTLKKKTQETTSTAYKIHTPDDS